MSRLMLSTNDRRFHAKVSPRVVLGRALKVVGAMVLAGCGRADAPAPMATTRTGAVLCWTKGEVVLTPSAETSGGTPPAYLRLALANAAQRWNRALDGCRAPRLLANTQSLDAPSVRDDGVNAVILHEARWCPPGVIDRNDCYPSTSMGRTHLYLQPSSSPTTEGKLNGADVELNGVGTSWAEPLTPRTKLHLEALLLHELGHVLGLDHPCGANGEFERKPNMLRPCDDVSLRDRVMHPTWAEGERDEQMAPSRAEVAAVCSLYQSKR